MPYDEQLVERIRKLIQRRKGITERKMFGGIAFMLHGNMCCGVVGKLLVVRLGDEAAATALREPHAREMDFTGRVMKSMVYVDPCGIEADEDLRSWLIRAIDHARSLPPK